MSFVAGEMTVNGRFPACALMLCAAVLLAMPSSLEAGEGARVQNPSLTSTVVLQAGALYNQTDAEVGSRVRGTGVGGSIDLSDLGADNEHISPHFSLRWRATSRWHFDLAYQNLRQDGQRGAATQIDFSTISIPVGWNVATELDVDFYSAVAGYSFFRGANYELGGIIGLDVYNASARVQGSIFAGRARLTRAAEADITVPVPTLGIFGTYAFSDRLSIEGNAQYLFAEYDVYSGEIFKASAELKYWFTPHVALAVGYRHVATDISHEGDFTRDTFQVQFGGPFTALSVAF